MAPIPESVAAFISAGRVGRLGTANAAGQPMVVPICYAFDGEALFTPIDAKPKSRAPDGLGRVRNIRENPRVSVVIDHYEEDWAHLRWVLIQGEAEVLTGGPEFSRGADLLLAKYPQYSVLGLSRTGGTMIRVRARRVTEWRYSS